MLFDFLIILHLHFKVQVIFLIFLKSCKKKLKLSENPDMKAIFTIEHGFHIIKLFKTRLKQNLNYNRDFVPDLD